MRVGFGVFVFDSGTRELTRHGLPVKLAPKAFDLLQVLIEERPRAVSKQELRDHLWPDVVVEEANLKNLVGEIRSATGDPALIRTVHRFGYAFAAAATPADRPSFARLLDGDRAYPLRNGENVIGRDGGCSVVLDVVGLSRRHARISIVGERCTLEDMGSKNGTWLNGARVSGAIELHDGDRLRLAGLPLTFRSTSQDQSTASMDI